MAGAERTMTVVPGSALDDKIARATAAIGADDDPPTDDRVFTQLRHSIS
jgi:hypothetical protein